MIPGSDLLDLALTVIASQTISYYKALDRTTNDVGQDVTEYATPVTLSGSMQPVPRRLYDAYGLDLNRTYYTFYTSNNVIDIHRDSSGDQLIYVNQRYQVESNDDWYFADGWKGVLCVLIEDVAIDATVFGFGAANQNFGNGNFISGEIEQP